MRPVRYRRDGETREGTWTDEGIVADGCRHDLRDVEVLPPVAGATVVGVGLNHPGVEEGTDRYDTPAGPEDLLLYLKPSTTLVAHGEPATLRVGDDLRYEAELGVVVAERCRDVSPGEAMDHVAGFTCVNDVTDYAVRDMELTGIRAQGIDDSTPVGPVVAPPDLVPDDARVELAVDGEVVRTASRSEYRYSAAEVVAEVTRYATLLPGDVVSLGSAGGYGPPTDGDTVTVSVEGVGTLRTTVRRP